MQNWWMRRARITNKSTSIRNTDKSFLINKDVNKGGKCVYFLDYESPIRIRVDYNIYLLIADHFNLGI